MFNPDPAMISAGLKVMGLGLAGVFTVLILFYLCTKGMVAVFTKLEERKKAREAAR